MTRTATWRPSSVPPSCTNVPLTGSACAGVRVGRDPDRVPAGDDAVGGVEFDPSPAGDKDFGPGRGRAAAGHVLARVVARGLVVQAAGNEPRGESQAARGVHEQQREIAFCRAMSLPARYASGYLGDIGVPCSGAGDFCA